ncbi:hypothetical protein RVV18_002565 [Burkholderia ambifaria]|uniref:Uncharacterized protein n=1 Tax=Burkholderia ambifaria (strain ATCC BAA-244 / DSM 16087 / CCUG 44356 / LMG 19182 / AMMD) TaxID=339670 RepID=Q0BE44_BURCM|nr:hypothetical protein [Burkholderia ambifaria]ABI87579.1 conserved hypothetical protein [Burkholderia ambifaria AMMD]AJY22442.1 putative transmembrane protein [Burkholderia ambifaria AMMD]ELK6207122.1 hypothetical protein [Burkholderia ambifaria]MBR7929070.1 hypothetical protein [Burkholderia ambifaria]NHL66648.1 hypothetical protein [Burkholderia ambifaria]
MKPLLRAVLIVDAMLLLGFGVLFVLTPWQALFNALQLANIQPAMLGQAFGIALLGLAWLAFHAAVNGELTTPVARVVGHVNWLIGVLTVVWSFGTGNGPALAAAGRVLSALAGVALIVLGLGGVRLASAVRRREKALVLEARDAKRPAEPAPASAPQQRVEPVVGRPVAPAAPAAAATPAASDRLSGSVAFDARPPSRD